LASPYEDAVEVKEMLTRHSMLIIWIIGALLVLLAIAIALDPDTASGLVP
jgi:hypothetical protein